MVGFRWFIDNEIVPGNHGTTLKLDSVSRESNNKIVKCEVWNDIGKSEETETLDIHCKSSIISRVLLTFLILALQTILDSLSNLETSVEKRAKTQSLFAWWMEIRHRLILGSKMETCDM